MKKLTKIALLAAIGLLALSLGGLKADTGGEAACPFCDEVSFEPISSVMVCYYPSLLRCEGSGAILACIPVPDLTTIHVDVIDASTGEDMYKYDVDWNQCDDQTTAMCGLGELG